MKLHEIEIRGTMSGPIWWPAGEICETEFRARFNPPNASRSPFRHDWETLDEALQRALDSGDFQGGIGDIVCGEIIFHLAGDNRRATIAKPLDTLAAAQSYMAKIDLGEITQ